MRPALAVSSLERRIEEKLRVLEPESVELVDESSEHVGHPGAKGGGHYRLTIISEKFEGQSRIARHRLIYAALGDLVGASIHALAIHAYAPSEL